MADAGKKEQANHVHKEATQSSRCRAQKTAENAVFSADRSPSDKTHNWKSDGHQLKRFIGAASPRP